MGGKDSVCSGAMEEAHVVSCPDLPRVMGHQGRKKWCTQTCTQKNTEGAERPLTMVWVVIRLQAANRGSLLPSPVCSYFFVKDCPTVFYFAVDLWNIYKVYASNKHLLYIIDHIALFIISSFKSMFLFYNKYISWLISGHFCEGSHRFLTLSCWDWT